MMMNQVTLVVVEKEDVPVKENPAKAEKEVKENPRKREESPAKVRKDVPVKEDVK